MTILLRLFAWLLAAAVTFATLGPPQYRPHSNFGQDGEHALAFVLIGLAFGLAYPRNRLFTVGVAVVLIGVLELLQLWMPGRHARLEDFAVDAMAACAGFAITATLDLVTAWSRRSSKKSPRSQAPRGVTIQPMSITR
jgi:VanZ family protein